MPIDWKAVEKAVDDSEGLTNDKLASRVSSLTCFNDDEVRKLFPTQGDVEKLSQLMQIVNSSASEQKRINALAESFERLAGTVLKLLGKLV